jgi:hypothetical protein
MPLAQHLCLRLVDNRVIAPTPHQRRVVARVVLEQGRRHGLLAFGLADTHLHLLATCSRPAAGQLARRVELGLTHRLRVEVGFAAAYIKPVSDGAHLRNTFIYVLEQCAHHGLPWDPLHEASNLPDLLGLRPLGAYTAANVRRALPRVTRETLLACMRLIDLQPADGPLEHLVVAVVAVTGVEALAGRSTAQATARHLAVCVAGHARPAPSIAALLGVSTRTIHALRGQPADPRLLQAVRLQLGLIQHRAAALERRELPFTTR